MSRSRGQTAQAWFALRRRGAVCRGRSWLAAWGLLFFAAACSDEGARLRIETVWTVERPDPGSMQIFGSVIGAGRQTEANGGEPISYEPPVEVPFRNVPFETGLVVELRFYPTESVSEGREPTARPLYFGRSEPFDFGPGDDRTVEVPISLRFVEASLLSFSVRNASDGIVNTPELQLELEAVGAETVQIAQNLDFTVGVREYEADALEASGDSGPTTYALTYDLNETRPEDCAPDDDGKAPLVCEGPRQVLARVLQGPFESESSQVQVDVDTVPPDIAQASRSYVADQTNPLNQVTKAKDRTTILVTLSFTEALDGAAFAPKLTATNGTDTLDFVLQTTASDVETSATFSVVVDETLHSDGVYVPTVEIQDIAGNRNMSASFSGPDVAIEVDTTADPLVVQQDQVSYIRSPIGNADAEDLKDSNGNVMYTIQSGVAFYELGPPDGLDPVDKLDADTFELAGGTTPTLLRAWADDQRQNLLGTTAPDGQGDWPRSDLQLVNLDTPQVYVTALDDAGNESDPVLVQNAWYVGSTAQPAFGSSPHATTFSSQPVLPLSPRRAPRSSRRADSPDEQAEIARAERAWVERAGLSPVARDHALAYDSARGRVVLFSGLDSSNNRLSETWEWDGTSWTEATPPEVSASPPARANHALAYDSARGRVVLFAGFDNSFNALSDTWEWDGTSWTDVTPSDPSDSPPARSFHALAYDSARGEVVLFGGGDSSNNTLSDTWEWDGTSWTEVMPSGANASPPARGDHALAYDSARGRVVLFGGVDGLDGNYLSDTWEWDGTSWTEVTPSGANASPSGRLDHALAYDSARGRVVLYGGLEELEEGARRLSDTWEWDGTSWTKVTPIGADASPPARIAHALAYDIARGRVVLFGGFGNSGVLSDTWEWDGTSWTEVTPYTAKASPSARDFSALGYHSARGRVVLFGGRDPSNDALSDTWEWDGTSWTEVTPSLPNAKPSGRAAHALAYDNARERLVLFGGIDSSDKVLSDTWEWDGTSWTEVTPSFPNENPPARLAHGLAYDRARDRVVLAGGFSNSGRFADTWVWDGTSWTDMTPRGAGDSFPARRYHAMAYDSARRRVVLFGGEGRSGLLWDTWEWDGTSWTEVTPSVPTLSPSGRAGPALAYDGARGRVVLFGGDDSTRAGRRSDTWEWDGTSWMDVTPLRSNASPLSRVYHALAYDRTRGRGVLFGGGDPINNKLSDTWEILPPRVSAAQLVLQVPVDLEQEALSDLRVRAFCGGSYENASGGSADGARLLGWVTGGPGKPPGAFEVLATNTTGIPISSGTAGLMDYRPTGTSVAEVAQGFFGPERRMYFECRPDGPSGSGFAEVALDYMEVRVKYEATP